MSLRTGQMQSSPSVVVSGTHVHSKHSESTSVNKASLPPANEVWGKVIFLYLSVILFTGGYRQVHPLGRYTPLPGQIHPPGRYTPPWAGTPSWAGTPHGRYPQQCMLGYGQQTGGTHPTGMHSCWQFNFGWHPKLVIASK